MDNGLRIEMTNREVEEHKLKELLPDEETTFWTGFSCPASPSLRFIYRMQARQRVRELGLEGSVVAWEDVTSLLEMSEQALHAKAMANEALQTVLDNHRTELCRRKEEYEQVVLEENALEEDSGFLRQQMERLLRERRDMQQEIEQLRRANQFLLEERELVFDQLEFKEGGEEREEEEEEGNARFSLTSAVASKMEEQAALRRRLEESREATQAQLEAVRMSLQQQERQFKDRESSLVRCLEQTTCAHMDAMRCLRKAGMPVEQVPPLPSGAELLGDVLAQHQQQGQQQQQQQGLFGANAAAAGVDEQQQQQGLFGASATAAGASEQQRREESFAAAMALDSHYVGDDECCSSSLGSEGGMSDSSSFSTVLLPTQHQQQQGGNNNGAATTAAVVRARLPSSPDAMMAASKLQAIGAVAAACVQGGARQQVGTRDSVSEVDVKVFDKVAAGGVVGAAGAVDAWASKTRAGGGGAGAGGRSVCVMQLRSTEEDCEEAAEIAT